MNYHYPIEEGWSTEEIIQVIQFFECIEKAYEGQIDRLDLIQAYKSFKKVVPSKSEEKSLFKLFKQSSNYESYLVVRKALNSHVDLISMKDQ